MKLLSAARKTAALGKRQGAGSLCRAAPLKRAEPHRAAAAASGAGGDAPLGRLRSLPARPGGQGRWEGGRAQLSGQPRAPMLGHCCGARGANSGTGHAGSGPAEDGAESPPGPAAARSPPAGMRPNPNTPSPFPTVLSPRAAPSRLATAPGEAFPPLLSARTGRGGRRGLGRRGPTHRPAGASEQQRQQQRRRQQRRQQQRQQARPGDGSAGGSEVARRQNGAVSGGWRGMRPGAFPCAWGALPGVDLRAS